MSAALAKPGRYREMKKVSLFGPGLVPDLSGPLPGFDLEAQVRVHALGREFSASNSFIRRSFDGPIPPYLERRS